MGLLLVFRSTGCLHMLHYAVKVKTKAIYSKRDQYRLITDISPKDTDLTECYKVLFELALSLQQLSTSMLAIP